MRKIISKPEGKRKKRAKQVILGVILAVVITLSTIGYSFDVSERKSSGDSESIIYNEFEFIKEESFWTTFMGNQRFYFSYNPNEAKTGDDAEITKTLTDYSSKPLYISSESPEAEYEIYRNLDRFILRRQYACLNSSGKKCDKNYPVKTCDDDFIIIEKRNSGNNEIRQEQNCIFISGKEEELVKLADRFLFEILEIQ